MAGAAPGHHHPTGTPRGQWRAARPLARGRSLELNNLSADLDRMARSLLARERELEAIFNVSPIGIAVTSLGRQPRIIKVNDTLLQLFWPSSPGAHRPQQCRSEHVGRSPRSGAPVSGGGARPGGRDGGLGPAGRWRSLLAAHTVRTYTDASGQDRFAVIVLRDITELRRIEDEIRHPQRRPGAPRAGTHPGTGADQ